MSNEIEMDHQYYCPEQGMFCRFMDNRSGYCVATSCKTVANMIIQDEIDRRAKIEREIEEGRIAMLEDRYSRAMEQLENYGAIGMDLEFDDEEVRGGMT